MGPDPEQPGSGRGSSAGCASPPALRWRAGTVRADGVLPPRPRLPPFSGPCWRPGRRCSGRGRLHHRGALRARGGYRGPRSPGPGSLVDEHGVQVIQPLFAQGPRRCGAAARSSKRGRALSTPAPCPALPTARSTCRARSGVTGRRRAGRMLRLQLSNGREVHRHRPRRGHGCGPGEHPAGPAARNSGRRPLLIRIDPTSAVPLGDQVAASVRRAIADGQVVAGEKLPPAREVAESLGINLHTVLRGYQRLRDEGLVDLRRGRNRVLTSAATSGHGQDRRTCGRAGGSRPQRGPRSAGRAGPGPNRVPEQG